MPLRRSTTIAVTTTFLLVLVAIGVGEAYMVREKLMGSLTDEPSGIAVMKAESPDVRATIDGIEAFTVQATTEPTLLENVVPAGAPLERIALLHNGEYAGTLTWITSTDVKTIFIELKEALLPSFTPAVTGLTDETFQEPGLPVRNRLAFRDPGLGQDAFILLRVRDRLYEVHVAQGKEADMEELVNALSQ